MKITIVAGARPNFIKIAPIIKEIQKSVENSNKISFRLVHTGQHYDHKMRGSFFEQLSIPEPDINLECGGGTQAEQTASIMINFEKEIQKNPTDLVLVVGDVTSTMACAITAKKLGIKVAHVEAGIRSNDRNMPEEINRLLTDSISDYFFTTSETASNQLIKEGVSKENIFFLNNNHLQGNVNAAVKLGLYYNDELVSVMTFGKLRLALGNKKSNIDEYEMYRYCNKLDTNIIGGASKLLDYFFNYDYIYDVEYRRVQNYLREHSIDDSIAMLIDRKSDSDGCIIAKIDSIDGVIVEVEFDERNLKWHVLQVFKVVEGEGGLDGRCVEPVLDEETMVKVVKLIDQKARGF